MRVAIYLRVSSEEQTKGHSLDTQRDALTEWASREGWDVVETFEDAGISATNATKRPAFMRMIQAAKEGQFEMVLVKRRDRFARNLADAGAYEQLLGECGVRVWSHDESATNEDTPAGFLMKGMLDVFAAHYSVELSKKTADGWRKRAEKGLPVGDVPFGYRSVGPQSAPELVSDEAEAVFEVFKRYASGEASMVDLAQYLDGLDFRPRSKRGLARFTKDNVGGMLSNRFYVGEVAYKDEFVSEGQHEAIIDEQLWARVTEARHRRASRQGLSSPGKHPYLLRGIGTCSACSAILWGNRSRHHHYYRCAGQRRGTGCANGSRGVRAEVLEEKVAALFRDVRIPDDWHALVRRMLDDQGFDRDGLEAERARIQRRIERVREALFEGLVDIATARNEFGAARVRLKELEQLLAADPRSPSLSDDFINVRRLWPHMTSEERQAVVQASLEAVEVDLEEQRVVGFKPRPEMEPLFEALEEAGSNVNNVCAWRPRAAQVHPIPTLPAVHAQALGLLSDPATSIPQLGKVVETDPALTVSVLRAANSAASAPVSAIGTPAEAIVRIGLNTTRKIITAAVVSESFNRLDYAGIDSAELWRHLFTTALVADASAWGAEQRSTAFTAGLLHLIGRMAMAQSDPQRYTQVAAIARTGRSVLDSEASVFGYDSQSWGVEVARAWDVPDEIVEAIGGFSDGSLGPLAWVAWNGRRVAAALGIGDGVHAAEQMDIYGELAPEDDQLLNGLGGAESLLKQADWMLGSVTKARAA